MVSLPYRSESQVSLPQMVRPYSNGKIPPELLQPCGIRSFVMVEPAARACRAMVTAARADGILLDATGTYRSYDQQLQLFTQRYSKSAISGARTKSWNGATYWLKPGMAMAATPGTSKHGLGVTPDLAQRSTSGALQGVGPATLAWLAAHGPSFGFWNSVKSEPWHWPYFNGDDIPAAVLEMERTGKIRLQPAVPSDPAKREEFYSELPHPGVLSKGARGPAVEAMQWALTRAGFAAGIDGAFGPATERSVKEFQAAKGMTVDGLVGPKTWAALGLMSDDGSPRENVTTPTGKPKKRRRTPPPKVPEHGAVSAAVAAYKAGFRGDDLAPITMIAGRESGWQSDRVNPNTSDRGMWQINWKNLQGDGYTELRTRLGITSDTDLLDVTINAAVAFFMFEDSKKFGEPWFPWRGSETGHDGSGPGWDPKGSHLWHTERFADAAKAAAEAVIAGKGRRPKQDPTLVATPEPVSSEPVSSEDGGEQGDGQQGASYTIAAADSDGFIAVVGRCLGIGDAPWALRFAAATAVAEHNGKTLDDVFRPGDVVRFPAAVDGVRCYAVKPGNGLIAIATGLGLGRAKADQQRVAAINAWQGPTPHVGATWYGGAA